MAIFICHASSDNAIATKVYDRLANYHSIPCYIDDIDKELSKRRGKSELTSYLVDKLKKCDTLFAVVTQNTKQSWWVPFEIGTARQLPIIITSYTNLPEPPQMDYSIVLPEYLLEWPRLRTDSEVDFFAQKYITRGNSQVRSSFFSESHFSSSTFEKPRDFELSMMRALNQRTFI